MEEDIEKLNLLTMLAEIDNINLLAEKISNQTPEADNTFFKSQTTPTNKNFVNLEQFKDSIIKGDTTYCCDLIDNGEINLFGRNSSGFTALMMAIIVENFAIANKLIDTGDTGAGKKQIKEVIKIFPSSTQINSALLIEKRSFLFHLIEFNKVAACKYLIEKDLANKNELSQDERNINALMFAILKNQFSIANYLIDQGADIGYLKKWRYDDGDGPTSFLFYLIDIIDTHSRKAIFYLIDKKLFDKDEKDTRGFSLLMAAITAHRFPLADGLIERGMGKEVIVFSELLKKNDLKICQYVIENQLVDINEEHIRIAKKLKFTSIVDHLVKHLDDKQKNKCLEIKTFFDELLKMEDSPIIEITPLPAFNQLRIDLNNQYTHSSALAKNIDNTLSGKKHIKLEPGKPLKTFILSLNELKESDFTQLKQVFKLEKQITYQTRPNVIDEQAEPFIEPRVEKTKTYIKPPRETKKAPAGNFSTKIKTKKESTSSKSQQHKPANTHRKRNANTKQVTKTTQPPKSQAIETVNSPRNFPKAPRISFFELETVKKHSESIGEKSYLSVAPRANIVPKYKKLSFSYYQTETISIIDVFTLPAEKQNHLSLLMHLCSRVENQLNNIDQNQSCIFKQALLYDLFLLLELIQKTFKLTNKSDDLLPMNEIKQLRQLIKETIFNERRQNLNLNNLIKEAQKICDRLQLIFNSLEKNQLTAINPLNIELEDLKISHNQIHSSFNLAFFKNYDPLTSIEYFNIIPYVAEFLNYVAIIEDDNEELEKKMLALSAARWCVLGLDKKQSIFQNYMGNSPTLNDIFINVHIARNRLAHIESSEKKGVVKNPNEDEKIILELKKFIIQLQENPTPSQQSTNFVIKI